MIHEQNSVFREIFVPTQHTAGHTNTGYIDVLGADYAVIDFANGSIVGTGVATATGGTLSIGSSDDTNVSNAATLVANLTGLKFASARRTCIDTKTGCKRYIHVTFTAGSAGASNEPQYVSCTGFTGRLQNSPTSTGGMVNGLTNNSARIVVSS